MIPVRVALYHGPTLQVRRTWSEARSDLRRAAPTAALPCDWPDRTGGPWDGTYTDLRPDRTAIRDLRPHNRSDNR